MLREETFRLTSLREPRANVLMVLGDCPATSNYVSRGEREDAENKLCSYAKVLLYQMRLSAEISPCRANVLMVLGDCPAPPNYVSRGEREDAETKLRSSAKLFA
jgi:hypothetical protein